MTSRGWKVLGLLGLALVLVLGPGSGVAHAVTCSTSWANPVDGDWDVAGNWTNGVPDSTNLRKAWGECSGCLCRLRLGGHRRRATHPGRSRYDACASVRTRLVATSAFSRTRGGSLSTT